MTVQKTINETAHFDRSPDEVWKICGDPADISSWLPAVDKSWMDGDVRYAELAGGAGQARERITEQNDSDRFYDYEYVDGPLPLNGFTSRLAAVADGAGTVIQWTASFTAPTDADGEQLAAAVSGMYQGGLGGIETALNSSVR